jgi:aromatic-amino-acid transaminase
VPSFLIHACADRPGDDPIFALNAEATARARSGERVLNATLGALMEDDGKLGVLPSVFEAYRRVDPAAAAPYAPIAGPRRFLDAVSRDLFGRGALADAAVAVATPGGTGALHHAVVNYLEPGQKLLAPSFYWSPYATIAEHARRGVETFEMFDSAGRFHLAALERALERQLAAQERALLVLNMPCNNPTGYSLDRTEWEALGGILRAQARRGRVAVLVDFAYARFAAPGAARWQDVAADLVGEVQWLVAWSASKSYAQYGARIGALVAPVPDASQRVRVQAALGYSCRATWSNCNHLGLLAVTELLEDAALAARCDAERERLRGLLASRVAAFNVAARQAGLAFPRYEGGFFVTVFARDARRAADSARRRGVYVVPITGALRVALCSTPADRVGELAGALAAAIGEVGA